MLKLVNANQVRGNCVACAKERQGKLRGPGNWGSAARIHWGMNPEAIGLPRLLALAHTQEGEVKIRSMDEI